MAYNNRGGGNRFGGGGRHDGGYGGHGGNRRPPIQMHQATCSECKKSCEVPFRPSGDKPVFCSDCFKGKNNDSGGGRRDRDYSERPPKEMHEAVCSDCGKDCEVPFKPSGDKPIYCDKCFGKNKEISRARHTGGGDSKLDEKLTMINIKLDRILKVLDAGAAGKTEQEKTESSAKPSPKKSVVKKAKKKAKVKQAKV